MAYVSGIAGLGNSADALRILQATTASAIAGFSRATTLAELDRRYRTWKASAFSDFAKLTSNDVPRGQAEINRGDRAYDIRKAALTGVRSTASASQTSAAPDETPYGSWISTIAPEEKPKSSYTSPLAPPPADYSSAVDKAMAAARASAAAKSKPAEKGVFDAIGDIFSGVADAATSLLPTVLAVTKAQQERKQQEQLARLQAAGLLPQQQQAPAGMSTATKVALGAGGALLLGFIIYKVATR